MTAYEKVQDRLLSEPKVWLVTGVAGFIGSNLLEKLLGLNQRVIGLDNFSTGKRRNLNEVRELVAADRWARFRLIEGDIRNLETCHRACEGADFVLHQAALGSVPRSISDPISTNESNVTGHLNMLVAARDRGVRRLVYAASSSTYGDHSALPKVEDTIGRPLSPYAVTKFVNELYADVFARCYGLGTIGLRYFNVFGPRQDPDGAYAAVIPKWISAILGDQLVFINGDGQTSRDFCYVKNAVQANLLAATVADPRSVNQVYNVALNARTSLNDLHEAIRWRLVAINPRLDASAPHYRDFRAGDVRHSQADIAKAQEFLGYSPTHTLAQGLDEALGWYVDQATRMDLAAAL